jgi:hypothetical protein
MTFSKESAPAPAKGSWLGSLEGQVTIPPGTLETDDEVQAEFDASEIFPRAESDR